LFFQIDLLRTDSKSSTPPQREPAATLEPSFFQDKAVMLKTTGDDVIRLVPGVDVVLIILTDFRKKTHFFENSVMTRWSWIRNEKLI
jgi:hypothetical protein